MGGMESGQVLARFGAATRAWFELAFAAPTPAQVGAWAAISAGRHALVVAPTGSGKTLAAFLWSLDRLATQPPPAEAARRCRVLYVSPLKALAVDVERNLRTPLAGMRQAAARLGLAPPAVSVGMRTGDTPADERRAFNKTPPDILITTPESLFLLLTSAAREALRGVETVIVDEVHAVCATKRGAHLALSLERLDALLERPAQRIGLSATVRPIDETARFLGGAAPVEVVQPPAVKTIEVSVQVPVEDMTRLDEEPSQTGPGAGATWTEQTSPGAGATWTEQTSPGAGTAWTEQTGPGAGATWTDERSEEGRRRPAGPGARAGGANARKSGSIWPAVEERVYELIRAHRSTIVFTNSRRGAERLCARLNELADQRTETLPETGTPAEIMAQAGRAEGAAPVIARAHHGSVSKEERKHIEEALKSGQLPAVVATSSLELGIDMGSVDLVVQIEAPPTVAAGLQRIGRAGHHVGAISRGVVFPKHRGDLVSCAVVSERMREGAIEELRYPRNPLDVLAQQIVGMVAVDPWPVESLAGLVRRAAPFAELPDSALHAVLDMLAGRYPSTAFAELRPRLVWDRVAEVLTARPGAQRLAVTSGGTIPDRGMFGVFLAGSGEQTSSTRAARATRVGELDEEMVYESRVGDVFLLGSTSWRIEDITPDRVLVTPVPGAPARMPFWKGDAPGRPVELGRAIGSRLRELTRVGDDVARDRLVEGGLDTWAIDNLLAYLRDQREATRQLPDDRTILVERFRDELGDWRLTVHCVLGAKVNAPWALAIGRRLSERYGVDGQVMPSDDGIVVRLPDTVDEPPGADLVAFDPDEIASIVEDSVGTSAMFASRFRECAARALLLPRRDPRRRQPLWQQRQRSAQLLDVAREYADFPITLEAARECLQDVFDVAGLVGLMRDVAGRAIRLVEVETARPSPFARSLLFGYVGAFLYEGDAPLAERRAAALALDSTLLGELLGRVELRELLDPDVVVETSRRLQWLGDGSRRVRDAEDVAELLRLLGDLSETECGERGAEPAWLEQLEGARRAIRVRIAGESRWIAIEDAGRVRDALGAALPVGVPLAHLEPVTDPLGDLVARYAKTHGPFTSAACAARFGLGVFVVEQALRRLGGMGRVVSGEFSPPGVGSTGLEWCDAEVLRLLRRRSLAALRREIEPVPPRVLASFLPRWQHVGGWSGAGAGRGVEAVAAAVEQLQGIAVPASALERLILPARVADYSPGYLDELCAAGEVLWAGAGSIPGGDGWVCLSFADTAPLLLPPADPQALTSPTHEAVLEALEGGQALFVRALADRLGTGQTAELVDALWDLVWAGWLTNDTLGPLRARLAGGGGAHRSRPVPARSRYRRAGRPASLAVARPGPGDGAGRWSRLPARESDPTKRATASAEALLDRHGVVTRGAVAAEGLPGGFPAVYPVFAAMEDRGSVRRGYFIEGLGAAQFAVPGAVDRLRALADADANRAAGTAALVLAATDPANPYGAALPWPARVVDSGDGGAAASSTVGHRAGRKAGALVVIVDGVLALYVERGGRTLLSFVDEAEVLRLAAKALADAVHAGALGALSVERADGEEIHASPLRDALAAAGFRATPRGLRLRG
jgi:ATP-dependent Lhr-like helicase